MGTGDIVILVVSFMIVLGAGWFVLDTLNAEQVAYENFVAENTVNLTGSSVQFYPNLRYGSHKINYVIDPLCSPQKELDIRRALDILERKTILEFTFGNSGGIDFLCSEIEPDAENKNHFVAGEGGPTKIINGSSYYLIKSGQVSLYRPEKCDEPKVALHEILHSLGFDHNNNESSIMFPITNCDQVIDNELIEEIDRIYSIDSFPDLKIQKVEGNKTGGYLNFNIEIQNVGLIDSGESRLDVLVQGKLIDSYDLGEIKVGVAKTLNVGNLKSGRGEQLVEFEVVSIDPKEDLDLSNNKANIVPSV
jgi:hypothetical protein